MLCKASTLLAARLAFAIGLGGAWDAPSMDGAEPGIDPSLARKESENAESGASRYRWRRSDSSLALMQRGQAVWHYNYGPQLTKPHFHPVATTAGQILTWNQPPDHVWHHGLWFSWKFINGVNYWEHNSATGAPDGRTTWSDVRTVSRNDFSATITMELCYRAANRTDDVLAERRRIDVSSPAGNGDYHIDWKSTFTALQAATLDRTPPRPQAPGGYAGLSVRFADGFADRQALNLNDSVSLEGGDRYRGRSGAIEYSGVIDGVPVGLAIFDSPENPRHPTSWYLIRAPRISYVNAAFLQDEPLSLTAGDRFTLRYRVVVHRGRWDTAKLQAAYREFVASRGSAAND